MKTLLISLRKNWLSFVSYPRSAIGAIIFMFISDLFFPLVWLMVLGPEKIGAAAFYLGCAGVGFGLFALFFCGLFQFDKITSGEFEKYFLRPRSIFLQYASDYVDISGMGDLFFGLLMLSLAPHPIPIKLAVSITALLVLILFSTIVSAVVMIARAFDPEFAGRLVDILLLVYIWPGGVLEASPLKLFLVFIIPGLLAIHLPVSFLLEGRNILLTLSGFAFLFLLASLLWREALKQTIVGSSGWLAE